MKNKSNPIINTTTLVIILSIIIMLYFGYSIINPIIEFINTDIESIDNIDVIKSFFE